jgi:copper(I)-binding protein
MLIGLTKPLTADNLVDIDLAFEDGSHKSLQLPVQSQMMK